MQRNALSGGCLIGPGCFFDDGRIEGLQSVASTVFAGQHMATFAGQDVLVMSRATHLANLAAARSFKFSELATMVALMMSL